MNPEYLARSLLDEEADLSARPGKGKGKGKGRQLADHHDWILVAGLPPLAHLDREAEQQCLLSEEQARMHESMQEALEDAYSPPHEPLFGPASPEGESSPPVTLSRRKLGGLLKGKAGQPTVTRTTANASARKRKWESHDVYRAIEKKDLTTIFEIRDSAFHLLVQKTGSQTPLLYASRIGKSHKEIAILLTGALSRFVNQLPDDASLLDPQMQSQIRAVRANLKLAINESLTSNQTELVSSYLQIIIMAEGEKWVRDQTQNIALALRAGKSARPVQTARQAVTNFATRELRQLEKSNAVASVEDYLANATVDLVMMGLWSLVTDKLGGGLLPSYQFGRDERIFKTFSDSIHTASRTADYTLKVPKAIRSQVTETIKIMDGRSSGHAEKCRLLAVALEGPS